MQLKLAEKVEIGDVQISANQSKNKKEDEKNEIEIPSEDKDVKKENDNKDLNEKECYFFRTKTCKHGKSGKVPDKI